MAKEIGGYKHYTIDAKEEFANEYIARGIKANAEYEGYPLSTALARPLIAQKIIDIAKKEGANSSRACARSDPCAFAARRAGGAAPLDPARRSPPRWTASTPVHRQQNRRSSRRAHARRRR